MARAGWRRLVKPIVWVFCLLPLARLGQRALTGDLGANPIELITHRTGFWALVLLCAALAVTPLRRLTRQQWLVPLRRTLGLFAFFYVALHFTIWIGLDQFFAWGDMLADVLDRPYITAGFIAFLLLVPLALTSTAGWQRRLGRRWLALHRLVYLAAPLAALHFYWKRASKMDVADPLLFAAIIAALLALRVPAWVARRRRARARPAAPSLARR
ncbi:MAG TPA: protein-methionine-sulfoxide reductase heme-binding subunit MsrQ [Longimicrobiales bacterium]|nr:protein-methionine-sulfoxide reductase heme-binding subunit MsrQ [Longimicrobiales bacterium]